jgi:hypothetical protein
MLVAPIYYLGNKGPFEIQTASSSEKVSPQYDGNLDNDTWQQPHLAEGRNRREIESWLGKINWLLAGFPTWIGDFTGAGYSEVLFYSPDDQNWWLGQLGA